MLNHPYLVDFFEIFSNRKYHRDMKFQKILASNSKRFRFYGIFKKGKMMIEGGPGQLLHFLR